MCCLQKQLKDLRVRKYSSPRRWWGVTWKKVRNKVFCKGKTEVLISACSWGWVGKGWIGVGVSICLCCNSLPEDTKSCVSFEAGLSTFLWQSAYRDVDTVPELLPFCDILIGPEKAKTLKEWDWESCLVLPEPFWLWSFAILCVLWEAGHWNVRNT